MLFLEHKISRVNSKHCYSTSRKLTHTDEKGQAKMVDVGNKSVTTRIASAMAVVHVGSQISQLISENNIKKGDVLSVAKLAAIMGAKKTSELIPLCHNIVLNDVQVQVRLQGKLASSNIFLTKENFKCLAYRD